MRQSTRLIINTGATYARMLLTVGVGLYITRLALQGLGKPDYGFWCLCISVVSWFNMLSDAFMNSAERFLAHEIGRAKSSISSPPPDPLLAHAEHPPLRVVFASVLFLFTALALFFLVCAASLPFVVTQTLQIPEGRSFHSAALALAFTFVTWSATTLMVPYRSLMMSHQEFIVFTLIEVLDAVLRLVVVIMMFYSPYDKLETYTTLLAAESFLLTFICAAYCWKRYPEARVFPSFAHPALLRQMISLSSWSLLVRLAYRLRMSGPSTLLGIFIGPLANAPYGVANQAAGYQMQLAGALSRTSRPAIIQAAGARNLASANRLAFLTSKYSTWMVVILMVPLLIETPILLKLWLKDVPESTETFLRIACASAAVQWLVCGHEHAVFASGKVRLFSIFSVVTEALAFVAAIFCAYRFPGSPHSILLCVLFGVILSTLSIALFVGPRHHLPFARWLALVVYPMLLTSLPPAAAALGVHLLLPESFLRLVLVSLTFGASFLALIYALGLAPDERSHFLRIFLAFYNRIARKGPQSPSAKPASSTFPSDVQ